MNAKENMEDCNRCERNVSIARDCNGNEIVFIHDIIFMNRQNISWKEVEKYLKQYVGEIYRIKESGDEIFIGKDLPDEYCNSLYTRRLKGALAKTKANMVQAIPELIQISTKGKKSLNEAKKHRLDAKFGWYRYDSRVAMAVYSGNEIERYNVFYVRMIIRHDADGKKYLYDIINLKKEPSKPLG